MHALLAWAERHRRDLPWRRTRDPWAVLVSELMLQQTQAARVVPRWEAFLERFPTPSACASAPVGAVIEEWAGLGYNRRAVNLHRAATAVVEHHRGHLPRDLEPLLALPGVGPYTARAVLAFAFEADVGLLEVNTRRVLARAFAVHTQGDADALVPSGRGWAWNQALLDVGATVCTRHAPGCERCPLTLACGWSRRGRGDPDPAAHPARQSRFAGSDRQGRGRLVDALPRGPVALAHAPTAAGWPHDSARAERAVAGLVADGLARRDGDVLSLP